MIVVHKSRRDDVAELFKDGLCDEKIAEKTGLHIQTVKDYRSKLGLYREDVPRSIERAPLFVPEPKPLMEMAKDALMGRLTERELGYFLDGRPARINEIITAANESLTAWGLDQIGPNQWRV